MSDDPTFLDLVQNGTMSAEMGATLWAAMDRRCSFVVVAVPRLAGKSTVKNAMLSLLPPEVPIHRLSGEEEEIHRLKEAALGGYLVVDEFSQYAGQPTYIWGAPVRSVFDALTAGYSLATSLHAPSLEETFAAICQGNGVSDQDASRIKLMVYLRRLGTGPERRSDTTPDAFWRRMAEVYEIENVAAERPIGRLLYRWVEEEDRFESPMASQLLQAEAKELATRATRLREMAEAGRTTATDVAQMVTDYHR